MQDEIKIQYIYIRTYIIVNFFQLGMWFFYILIIVVIMLQFNCQKISLRLHPSFNVYTHIHTHIYIPIHLSVLTAKRLANNRQSAHWRGECNYLFTVKGRRNQISMSHTNTYICIGKKCNFCSHIRRVAPHS